uniref:CCHC-type domain-containing protein n=1 Tax=Vitis vinifera TaxID=29760 RepID=A5BKY7_VITVI|nr:hypothetical protein VITISV_028505 [Vitis vinifera]
MGTCINAFKGMRRLTSRSIVTPCDAHIGRVSHGAKNLNPVGNKILFFGLLEPSRTQLQELGGIMGCSLSSNITHVVTLTVQHHPSTLWYRDKLTRYALNAFLMLTGIRRVCWDFISPASSVINRRRDSECGPHHSINLGKRIHAPNHVRITTPCFVHVPVMQPANFSNIKCDIPELKGDNYKVWKERIILHLGCMDIDCAIRKDKPTIIDTGTTVEKALYEQWEQSNRLSLMFIKTKISDGIRGFVDQHDNVKALLKAIDEQFMTLDKALASTLIMNFLSLRLTNEGMLKMELGENALMTMERKDQNQAKKKGKGKIPPQGGIKKVNRCFFCKKKGHMKKGCTKFQKWLEKKGYAKPKEANANLGSQQSSASNGVQFGAEMKDLQPLEAEHRKLKGNFAALRNQPFAANSREPVLEDDASFVQFCKEVKDHLEWQVLGERYEPLQGASVINFVDYSLHQGAPAAHESAETPIGHESAKDYEAPKLGFFMNLSFQKLCHELYTTLPHS